MGNIRYADITKSIGVKTMIGKLIEPGVNVNWPLFKSLKKIKQLPLASASPYIPSLLNNFGSSAKLNKLTIRVMVPDQLFQAINRLHNLEKKKNLLVSRNIAKIKMIANPQNLKYVSIDIDELLLGSNQCIINLEKRSPKIDCIRCGIMR